MNLLSLLLRLLPLAVLFAVSGSGPCAAAETAAASAKFELAKTPVTPPELAAANERLALVKARYQAGLATKEEVDDRIYQRDQIERHTAYLLSIRSDGGPLSAFAAAAADLGEVSLTLINAATAADLETPLPPFNLKNANWGTVVGVLDSFLGSYDLTLNFVGGDSPNPAEAKSVVCVLRRVNPPSKIQRPGEPEFNAFQLEANIFDEQTVDTIVDAIRSAWALEPGRDRAALLIKFHPPTTILLVSGPAPATDVARQVIGSLRKKPVRR